MELDLIALAVALLAAVMGGGGLAGWLQTRRQFNRQTQLDYFEVCKERIALAEKRGDEEAANRHFVEYDVALSAWQGQQKLEAVAPREVDPEGPSLSANEISLLLNLLASTQGLPQSTVTADGHFLRGNAFYEVGDFASAINEFSEAIRINPNFAFAYNNRGNSKRNLGEYESAISDYGEMVRLEPDLWMSYSKRGNIYFLERVWARA